MITFDDFTKLDIRIGTVVRAYPNEKARKPALVLEIDFGELGVLTTSAQITQRYNPDALPGRQVAAVVNFPPKNIAGITSQVLVLGGVPAEHDVVLLAPDFAVPNGTKVA